MRFSGNLASKNTRTGDRAKSKKLEKIEKLADNIIGSPKEAHIASEHSQEAES